MTLFSDITGTYGNFDKTVGIVLPLGYNGGVAFGADANTTLTTLDLRRQVINPTASRNYTLPTGALLFLGDTWTFINQSSSYNVVLKASDATTIGTVLPNQTVTIFAKQDNPTTNTHWITIGVSSSASFLTSSFGPISLTNNVVANGTTLSLGIGDWDVTLMSTMSGTASPTTTQVGVSLTSLTFDGSFGDQYSSVGSPFNLTASHTSIPTVVYRFSVASPTTVYAVLYSNFGAGTVDVYGRLSARLASGM